MPRERGGIRRRVCLSYAPHETRNKILDDSTSNGDMPRGRGGNTRKRGLLYAPQGIGDEIVSDSTSNEDRYRGRGYDRGQEAEQKQVKIMEDKRDRVQAEYHVLELHQKGHFQNHYSKLVASRDKEVNMAVGDSDNALVCCVENTAEDSIAFWCIIPYYLLQRRVRNVQATLRWTLKDVRWYGKAEESFFHNVNEDKKTEESAAGVAVAGVAVAAQMKYDTTLGIRRVTGLSEAEILHLWTRFIELENDSIVAEHGLSSEITQSLGGSSDTSERSQNSGSFEDSGRSDEEYSEDGASSKEEGSESSQVRRSTRESRAPVRYSPSANYLLLTENGEPDSYLEALSNKESVQWKKAIIEEMVSLKMNETCSLVRLPAGKNASQSLWMFMVKEEQDGSKSCEDDYNQLAGQKENLECRLKKIMYGLIQALRLRYLKFNSFMQKDKVRALTWQNSTSLSGSFP
ncbi:hypothetical protein Tco_0561246 [Tanacetum coccineum]